MIAGLCAPRNGSEADSLRRPERAMEGTTTVTAQSPGCEARSQKMVAEIRRNDRVRMTRDERC